MRNYLTIAGRDSRDFGVYISGQGTFSAPEKAYEFYDVPGRNGAIIGNDHRLENIEVSYECFIYTNFSQNIADFRSFLLSLDGYQRLTDSYHPDEFRMAVYAGPFEPEVTAKNDAGSFTLTFICKPQRFLVSGETAYSWVPGGAHEVQGYELQLYAPLVDESVFKWEYDYHDSVVSIVVNAGITTKTYWIPTATEINVSIDGETEYSENISAYKATTCKADLLAGTLKVYSKTIRLPTTGWAVSTNPMEGNSLYKMSKADVAAACGISGISHLNQIAHPRYWIPSDGFRYTENNAVHLTATYLTIVDKRFVNDVAGFEAALESDPVYLDVLLTTEENYTVPTYDFEVPTTDYFTVSDTANNRGSEKAKFTAAYEASDAMRNPTNFRAAPLIRTYGTGSFVMDGVTVTISSCSSYVDIDCELMDCYEGSTNRNDDVTFSTYDFPLLQPGENTIDNISGITSIKITPRWWIV